MRIVPGNGLVIHNAQDQNLDDVIDMGCWTALKSFGDADADLTLNAADGQLHDRIAQRDYQLQLAQAGRFNQLNAAAALLAAQHAGVPIEVGIAALAQFDGVKRRQEIIGVVDGITLYDDFAHHPTAIRATLQALRPEDDGQLIAVFEPRSNTMKMGVHAQTLGAAFADADAVLFYDNGQLEWDAQALQQAHLEIFDDLDRIIAALLARAHRGDRIVIMSNGGFGGIHARLLQALRQKS